MNKKEQSTGDREIIARTLDVIKCQEWKSRLLIRLALAIGVVSITAGVALAFGYCVWLDPRLKELQAGYANYEQMYQTSTNATPQAAINATQAEQYRRSRDRLHMDMTHALGVETMLIAGAVALVGVGSLTTVVLIMVTRRVTLRQINESLIQISSQIRQLENRAS